MIEFDLPLLMYGLAVGLGAGAVGGLLAGLAGVGGGLIYVPVFYALMPGDSESIGVYIFASLVAVVLTGYFSARSHWKLGHVDLIVLKQLLPGLVVGAGLGLWSTLRLPEASILLALSALNGWVAYDYGRKPARTAKKVGSLPILSGPIGFISGVLGIGGGTMLVPLLRRFVELRFAVGTSAVCGAVMALGAVAMNSALETDWLALLSEQASFLFGAWLGIVLVLPFSSGWSARLHGAIEEEQLRLPLKSIFTTLSAGLFIAVLLA